MALYILVTVSYEIVGIVCMWRRSAAVECRTLDRENPVTNPLHILGPLMATRYGSVTPRQDKILVCT